MHHRNPLDLCQLSDQHLVIFVREGLGNMFDVRGLVLGPWMQGRVDAVLRTGDIY